MLFGVRAAQFLPDASPELGPGREVEGGGEQQLRPAGACMVGKLFRGGGGGVYLPIVC